MALKIQNIYGVTCIKGDVVASQKKEIENYFRVLLTLEDSVIINLCAVKQGFKQLSTWLDTIIDELPESKSLHYFSYPGPAVQKLYEQLNDPANFYQAAA